MYSNQRPVAQSLRRGSAVPAGGQRLRMEVMAQPVAAVTALAAGPNSDRALVRFLHQSDIGPCGALGWSAGCNWQPATARRPAFTRSVKGTTGGIPFLRCGGV